MNSNYLTEAFKKLNLLNEEIFDADDEGVDEFKELITSDDDIVDIIDSKAETEEELEDSYVGKVVLDCSVCHSKIYKDADSVVIDDSKDLANVGEECPYCYSVDGYKIIGQIAPYEEDAELKVEVEDKDEISDDEAEDLEDASTKLVSESLKGKKKNNKNLKEDFERVELETEDKVIKVSEEPKEELSDEEMIEPLDLDTEKEIVDSTNEENAEDAAEDAAEDEAEDEFVDQDFDEFEEEDFDDLGESYLKKVYENVDSFKTSKVSTKGNTLKLEGIIKFNSGNKKVTTFLFEAKDITKKGKVRFIGENKQITRGKKAFTLTGSIKEKKLIAESLNYNYRTKGADGKSVRLYGTVKK